METETKTRVRIGTTVLGHIKRVLGSVLNSETKNNDFISDVEDINSWDTYVDSYFEGKCSDSDRASIKAIIEEEKKLKKRKEQIKNAKKSTGKQIGNSERRPDTKVKIAERNDKELV
ncbi:MAG: hypothetical protein IKD76_06860 [Clostridia bacterium]|nr:hypothetical protein [Clostridia bacterium]